MVVPIARDWEWTKILQDVLFNQFYSLATRACPSRLPTMLRDAECLVNQGSDNLASVGGERSSVLLLFK